MASDQFGPVTYGDSQERYSRLPVRFRKLPKGQSGEFQAKPDLQTLFSAPGSLLKQIPQIVVDPQNTDISGDLATAVRHEAIHALLDHLGMQGRQAASEQPNFPDAAQAIFNKNRAGNFSQEAPAYFGSNDPNFQDPSIKMAFMHGFLNTLSGMDRKTADIIRSMPGNAQAQENTK